MKKAQPDWRITDACYACGCCVEVSSAIFSIDRNLGKALVTSAPVGTDFMALIKKAASLCPVGAIQQQP